MRSSHLPGRIRGINHRLLSDAHESRPNSGLRRYVRSEYWVPATLTIAMLAWAAVVLAFPHIHFVLIDPKTKTGFEIFVAVLSLFVALILVLFPDEAMRQPLR